MDNQISERLHLDYDHEKARKALAKELRRRVTKFVNNPSAVAYLSLEHAMRCYQNEVKNTGK